VASRRRSVAEETTTSCIDYLSGPHILYSLAVMCPISAGNAAPSNRRKVKPANITALFAGIGGMELGLHAAGHRTSLFCEIDPEALTVLRTRFPNVRRLPDVRATAQLVEQIDRGSDLLTAGFPCTDFSQAGSTKGFSGDQSSLILDVLRLLERRPFDSILLENVPNWRVLHGGAYLRHVLSALEQLGYRWAYRTIDALAFGSPQRRLRIFLFATLAGDPRMGLFHGSVEPANRVRGLHQAAHGFYWTEGSRGLGWGEDCVPTLKGGSAVGIPSPPAVLLTDGTIITPDIRDAERLQGFPPDWTNSELEVEVADKVARPFNQRRRWLLVGNAVNVNVSRWIGEQLLRCESWVGPEGDVLEPTSSLPPAAWFDGRKRRRIALSSWPVKVPTQPLEAFLSFQGKLLSYRATLGFFDRASKSTLRFTDGFLEAVQRHVQRMAVEYPSSTSAQAQRFFAFDSAVA
jgi:DNA (cytosine-5)-methyltransferase 1